MRKHTNALVAKSEEVELLEGRVFVTLADKGTVPPYLVWHPSQGVNTSGRVTGPKQTQNPRYTGHLVGNSAAQVEVLTDLLRDVLFPGGRGVRLEVDGEVSKPLWFEVPTPIQVQNDPQPAVIYTVVEVGWQSDPE